MNSHAQCEFGHFDSATGEYVITTPETPKPWLNYLWNREVLAVVSQTAQGYGFHQDAASLRTATVAGRRIYLQDADDGTTWTADGLYGPYESFACRHSAARTLISTECHGIEADFEIRVPEAVPAECWTLRLRNTGSEKRRLRVIAVLDSRVDGEPNPQGYYTRAETRWTAEHNAIIHFTHRFEEGNPPRVFLAAAQAVTGFDCRHDSFFGVAYRDGLPKAVRERRMGGSGLCLAEKSAFALESIIEIAPGAEAECLWLAGRYEKEEDIIAMLARAKTAAPETTAFPQPLDIRTGDAVFDHWCATWLQRQLAYNATWARDYFNGYRDLCQDVENLAIFDPQRAREKLLEILSYQYASGFAPRAWFNGKALDHGHGDSPVWIVFAVHALVCETGDLGLLDEIVPYYEKTESGSVMDHCRRVIDWYWNDRGENGLCLFRKGDWNDAMIAMGARGKGTSAWTTMAYHRALLEFAELASWMGADHTANEALQRAGTIRETIENVAWDGGWYLRGFTDDGDPVGSAKNAEGAIYANTQSWAVIGDAAPAERLRAAMAALDQQLEGDTGVRTLHNHYTRFDPAIGPITGQIPGFYQNGSIYMHTNMFKLTADCLLGRAEEAWAGIWKLLPFSTARIQTWGEPYVLPNCYFGPAAGYRHDRTGQSWMTASAGWLARILSRHLFGLQPAPDGLHIRPCLPHACDSWTITRRFRGAVYRVSCRRDPETTGGTRILVDGAPLDGDLLPHAPGGEFEVSVLLPWGK